MRKFALVLFAFIPTAFGGVEERFPQGALGLSWGATLQQVQSTYPGGLTWPVKGAELEGVAYVIPGDAHMLGVGTPVKLVQFLFTRKNELQTIFFHFNYSDNDAALFDVAGMLGQDYSVKDDGTARKYRWKPATMTQAQLEIGASTAYPWAQLSLQSISARRN